jgi:hypothetical protein
MAHLSIPDPAEAERGRAELLHALHHGLPLDGAQCAALVAILASIHNAREAFAEPGAADSFPHAAGVLCSVLDRFAREPAALDGDR